MLEAATQSPTAPAARPVAPKFEPLFEKLGKLAPLPGVAHRVLEIVANDDSCADDLIEAIEWDAAICTSVLRLANSAHCGLRRGVAELKGAVTLLGSDRVCNLAVTASMKSVLGKSAKTGPLDQHQLWKHSVCVAALSQTVAKQCQTADPEEAFLAGLLHDIGLIVMNQHLINETELVFIELQNGTELTVAEQSVLGFDHAQLGAHLTRCARFPDRLVHSIDAHHQPPSNSGGRPGLLDTISLANYLATRLGVGSIANRRLPPPDAQHLQRFGLDRDSLRDLWSEAEPTVEKALDMASV
ncbi:phosphodiesterase [Pseudobythopirellula maris]|uniref:Phosphodiesterase n=1 Tax=Pseudobythopirellula maris TaxID=2527991 RepID=A0A5C5ZTP5_9BACT|nr:HDOD domain-containing protein [Pseudobythopirellula maris]TWT90437.1 phosphodiesterase [Pseudobythopirellula maris]